MNSIYFGLIAVTCVAMTCWQSLAANTTAAENHTLTLRVIEGADQRPVAARVYLQGSDGQWHFAKPQAVEETDTRSPAGSPTALPYQKPRGDGSGEMHTTISAHPMQFVVPPGKYTLTVERGKEYLPVVQAVEIADQNVNLQVTLKRWIHMTEKGWFSGDTHIHRELADLPNLVLAEDVNLAFPLSHWVTTADADAVAGNRIRATDVKAAPIQVDPQHWIYPLNTEYEIFTVSDKPHTLGAFVIIGQKNPLPLKSPPVVPIAQRVHAEGALIDLEKHSWPWSVAIVPTMQVDLFELANNHCWRTKFALRDWTIQAAGDYMQLEKEPGGLTEWGWIDFGFQTYYALLNCGFRLTPTAGTGQGVHPVPMGFGRVYVHQPEGFSYEKWLQGLKQGRSFVTTGPMLEVTFNGKQPGEVFSATPAGTKFALTGTARAAAEIDRIEIVVAGKVVQTIRPENKPTATGGFAAVFSAEVVAQQSIWMAVRCFEKHPEKQVRFAHTAPVHVEVPGTKIQPRQEEIEYLIRRCREEVQRNRGVVGAEALAEFEQSLAFYEKIQASLPAK